MGPLQTVNDKCRNKENIEKNIISISQCYKVFTSEKYFILHILKVKSYEIHNIRKMKGPQISQKVVTLPAKFYPDTELKNEDVER